MNPPTPQSQPKRNPPAPLILTYSSHDDHTSIDATFQNAVRCPGSASSSFSSSSSATTPRAPPRSPYYPLLPVSKEDGELHSHSLQMGVEPRLLAGGRRTITKLVTALVALVLLVKLAGLYLPQYDLISTPTHWPSPKVLDRLKPADFFRSTHRNVTELPGPASAADAAEWRREHLWAAPDEKVMTRVIKQRKGSYHDTTVIFMHGMGESPYDCVIAAQLRSRLRTVRFVLPES